MLLPKTKPLPHASVAIEADASGAESGKSRAALPSAILASIQSSQKARSRKDERLWETLSATGAPWWVARSRFPEAFEQLSSAACRHLWADLAREKGLAFALATHLWLDLAFGKQTIRAQDFRAFWSAWPIEELADAWRDTAAHQAAWAQAVADSEQLIARQLEWKAEEQTSGGFTTQWPSAKDASAGIIPREKNIQSNTEKRLREGIACIEKLRASKSLGLATLSVIEDWARARTAGKKKSGAQEVDRKSSRAGGWAGLPGSQMHDECRGEENRVARWVVAGQMFRLKGLGIGSFAKIVEPAALDQEIARLAAQKFAEWLAREPQGEAEAFLASERQLCAAASAPIAEDPAAGGSVNIQTDASSRASWVKNGADAQDSTGESTGEAAQEKRGEGEPVVADGVSVRGAGRKPADDETAAAFAAALAALRAAKYEGSVAHCDEAGMAQLANVACASATRAPLFQKALRDTGALAPKDAPLRLASLSLFMDDRLKMGWIAGLSLAASDQKDAAGNPVSALCAPGMEAAWRMRWNKFANSCETASVSVHIWAAADHATRCLSDPGIMKAKNRVKESFNANQQVVFAGVEARELANAALGPGQTIASDREPIAPSGAAQDSEEQSSAKRGPRRM